MKQWGQSKKTFREIIESDTSWRRELRDATIEFNHIHQQNDHHFYYTLLKRIAGEAGVDFMKYEKEIKLQQERNRKKAVTQLRKLESKSQKIAVRQKELFDRHASIYAKVTESEYKEAFHNPALRMKTPWDYWTEITSPPPGMYGGGGRIPRATEDPDADLAPHPSTGIDVPTELHPSCSADIGPDYCEGTAEASLSQHMIYEHDAPPGNWFWVDRIWIALSAFGVASQFSGNAVVALSQRLELRTEVKCGIKVSIRQDGWHRGVRIVDEEIFDTATMPRWWWESEMTSSEPVIYDETLRTTPSTVVMLQGRDSGGGRIQVHVEVYCRAFAHSKNAMSSISFRSPMGIDIREVTLIPHGP